MHGSRALATLTLAAALLALPAGSSAAATRPSGHDEGLPNVDRRASAPATISTAARSARSSLQRDLGPLADVRSGPSSGAVAYVGRPTGLLTGPSSEDPRTIALGYVREHGDVFGLSKGDVANLVLVARDVSPDAITHLRFNQVLDGIESFDSGLEAHVTRDGRLINVSGAPVPNARLSTTVPGLGAGEGLGAARQATRSGGLPPRQTSVKPGASRITTFASGERARLRWSASARGPVLVWQVIADGGDGHAYDVLVDAGDGALLRRQDLTQHLGQSRFFRRDPMTTPTPTQITMPPAWYDDSAGGTRLWGQFARTYVDPNDQDPAPGSELGGTRVQIAASSAVPDWIYGQSIAFPGATPCPPSGCTWNSATPATSATNQFQAASNLHVLVSRYHDYLAAPPIGFNEASGNFQRTNPSGQGLGGDYVQAEVNDGQGLNNANMSTPPDGQAPRMQMFLWSSFDVNGSDDAGVVYHEYGHGLSNRLVVTASGSSALGSGQAAQMGEGWSDFYANDLLNAEGSLPDTPAPAEVKIGEYVFGPGGIRAKPEDCPVNPAGIAGCNGNDTATTVLGGYTYGDLAFTDNSSPHNGGEIWAETLWDIRTALGRGPALALITGAMRLSPDAPSMLDMRDAILQQAVAMRSASGAPDDYYDDLWPIFAARGMGASASTPSANAYNPVEAFNMPSGLRARSTVFRDPYPGGDNDGVAEPGERILVDQTVEGIGLADLFGVTGTLSSTNPALAIEDGTAAWPLLGRGRRAVNGDELAVRMPAGTCTTPSPISITLISTEGIAGANAVIDPRPVSNAVVPLADGVAPGVDGVTTTTFDVASGGSVTDVDVRIDDLRHSWLGDLRIELVHDGVTAVLFANLGSGNYSGDDIIQAIFDSDVGAALPTTGPGPITGRVRTQPANSLDAFDGHPAAGTWTLRIADNFPADTGELRRWGLDSPQVPCGRAEIPAAATDGASGVGTSAATLAGNVTPNGRTTKLRFSYGTTTSYGASSTAQDVGSGDGAVARAADVTGLSPGTTYHYRAEAIREGGAVAVAGADRTFTTLPAPPAPPAAPPPPPPPPPPPTAPGASGGDRTAPLFAGKIRVSLGKAAIRGRKRPTFTFTLSEPASVKLSLARREQGLLKRGRCVKPATQRAKGKRCARQVAVSAMTRSFATAGVGRLTLASAGLRRGVYVATLVATDRAANRSGPTTLTFAVP